MNLSRSGASRVAAALVRRCGTVQTPPRTSAAAKRDIRRQQFHALTHYELPAKKQEENSNFFDVKLDHGRMQSSNGRAIASYCGGPGDGCPESFRSLANNYVKMATIQD